MKHDAGHDGSNEDDNGITSCSKEPDGFDHDFLADTDVLLVELNLLHFLHEFEDDHDNETQHKVSNDGVWNVFEGVYHLMDELSWNVLQTKPFFDLSTSDGYSSSRGETCDHRE